VNPIVLPAITKTVTVRAPQEEAFRVFTDGIGSWWPAWRYSVGEEKVETVVFEAREGGRLYERWGDGTEHVWGTVQTCEPPERLVYSWHPGRDEGTAQEVEMRFVAEGEATRVEIEHRGWERLGEKGAEAQSGYDSGWEYVLGECYAGSF
jgi:uncharacterized protein YndB with AHSA1/START domain